MIIQVTVLIGHVFMLNISAPRRSVKMIAQIHNYGPDRHLNVCYSNHGHLRICHTKDS